ncbi:MAG: HNH endonuclease [Gammaproteobacteria bacterium]|nr:HNH endonuclease [Gammaproteobacteria bacterium]MYC24504.1 HNH endonuclease [Gammaproteobacteria bacterium]
MTTEDELIRMKRIARTYASFLGTKEIQREWLAPAMRSMRSLGTTQGVLVMQLYECHIDEHRTLDQKQFVDAIRLIESYILRRAVLGLRTASYWTLFTRMAFEIDPNESFGSLQVAFATLPHSYSFPSNEEFERALRENNMFLNRICRHLLDGLENYGQREKSPTHDYSIEHIMPQSIKSSKEWQSMLGADWESVHEMWLHKLGNLTLTAYNSKLSNSPFDVKKTTKGGFESSAVRLNKFVRKQDTWTEKQMADRGEELRRRAIEIWRPLSVSDEQIREAKRSKLLARAKKRTWDELEMPNGVRGLLESTLREIREISEIIEVVESKAGSLYTHWPNCFVELIPYKSFLRLTLPLTYSEIEKPQDLNVHDASRWKFVISSNHRGEHNVLVDIWSPQHIQLSMPLIRNALEQAN